MADQNNMLVVCKNGHQQPVSNSRFCIYCGIGLTPPTTQPNQIPANSQVNGNPQPNQFMPPVQQDWGSNFQPPNNQQPFQPQPNNQIQPFQQPPFNAPNYNQNFQQLQPLQLQPTPMET